MSTITLVFPHQLFESSAALSKTRTVYLVEEFLFFKQYKFHKQKIAFHRASMKSYEIYLKSIGYHLKYIQSLDTNSDIRNLIPSLADKGITAIYFVDPTDNWLSKRIQEKAKKHGIELNQIDSPLFINKPKDLSTFFKPEKKKFFQTSFYKSERKRLNVLMDSNDEPSGGQWSFDADNRKKYPKTKTPPAVHFPVINSIWKEAVSYTNEHFSDNLGSLNNYPIYPFSNEGASNWLKQFFEQRFHEFGDYEDAIVQEELILHHSLLSPLINTGLLHPKEVIEAAVKSATSYNVPLNSTEGFIRQILGWREFTRGMYEVKGSFSRTRNFWGFKRKIPASFYTGTTGILPVDTAIKKVLETGYCHHIERLMVLGNFMLLCQFDPDEVHRWFMELFIDAYDWVMVPNVYGMSQFADGGTFATKPYISGSNYLRKMSNYPKGDWEAIWDGLFWNFMDQKREFFLSNPRLSMLVRNFDKLTSDKKEAHLQNAAVFFDKLDG